MGQLITNLDKKLFLHNLEASNNIEAIQIIAKNMERYGYVKSSYSDAVVQREEVYPTGLQTSLFGVAIPHTDSEHVLKDSVAIATLKSPIPFTMMGTSDQQVQVEIIFMLAIKEPHGQLQLLQELTEVFQNEACLNGIKSAHDADEVIAILKNTLKSH